MLNNASLMNGVAAAQQASLQGANTILASTLQNLTGSSVVLNGAGTWSVGGQSLATFAAKAAAEAVIAETSANIQPQENTQNAAQTQTVVPQQNSSVFMQTTPQGIPVVPGFNGFGYDMNQFRQAMSTASMPYVNPNYTNPFAVQTAPVINPTQQVA